MDIFDFWSISKETLIIGFFCLCLLVFLFVLINKVDGFMPLLKKAIGTVLQQVCSLAIEAVCLVFKIINLFEIYIVLLIDALSGKVNSNGKIASLAIGVLSVASFYTTYSGIKCFIDQNTIAFLITLGIQAILLSTSLRINEVLNLDTSPKNAFAHKTIILVSGITFVVSCAFAYLMPLFNLSYTVNKKIYHTLYIMIIISAIIILLLIVFNLIKTGLKNFNAGIFLFSIYFAVLSVSSFFSYNTFVSVMYPETIRSIDTLQTYRLGVINLLERVDKSIDTNYYLAIQDELKYEMQKAENELSNFDEYFYLSQEEKQLLEKKNEFENYFNLKDQLQACQDKLEEQDNNWKNIVAELIDKSGGVGPNTLHLWEQMQAENLTIKGNYETELENIKDEIDFIDAEIKENEENYNKLLIKIANKGGYDCTEELNLILKLLQSEEWASTGEEDYRNAILKINDFRDKYLPNDSIRNSNNNLWNMITVWHSYLTYRKEYREIETAILSITCDTAEYDDVYNGIQKNIYELLSCLPLTEYTFYDNANKAIQTQSLPKSDYYSTLESLKRNANPGLHQLEKSIRTFTSNKLVGITCALMALLIDMMILFVGIILPQEINFKNNSKNKYTDQEIRRILANLFNKPIKR